MKKKYLRKKKKLPVVPKAVKAYVKKEINREAELKRFDAPFNNAPTLAGGVVSYVSGIGQGDFFYQRTGAKIKPVKWEFRYSIYNRFSNSQSRARVVVFSYNLAPNSAGALALPNPSDILKDANVAGACDAWSPINLQNAENIHILHDKVHTIMGNQITMVGNYATTTNVTHDVHLYGNLIKRLGHLQYNGASGVIGDGGKNALFVCLFDTVGDTVVTGNFSLWYTDI